MAHKSKTKGEKDLVVVFKIRGCNSYIKGVSRPFVTPLAKITQNGLDKKGHKMYQKSEKFSTKGDKEAHKSTKNAKKSYYSKIFNYLMKIFFDLFFHVEYHVCCVV